LLKVCLPTFTNYSNQSDKAEVAFATAKTLRKFTHGFCSDVITKISKAAELKRDDSRTLVAQVVSDVNQKDVLRDCPRRGQSTDGKPELVSSRSRSPLSSTMPAMTRGASISEVQPPPSHKDFTALIAENEYLKRQSRDFRRK
jgi:hypothetical protein